MSASAEQSTVTLARIASSPDLLATTTPVTALPSTSVSTMKVCRRSSTPASRHISAATSFTISGSNGVTRWWPWVMKPAKSLPPSTDRGMDRAAERLGPIDKLLEDALDELDLAVCAVRGHERPDQPGRGVAAEEAKALDEHGLGAVPGARDGGADAGWAAAHHQDVGLNGDRYLFGIRQGIQASDLSTASWSVDVV